MRDQATDFGIGVNYWPSASAMTWWDHVDIGEVADDFARIAGAGLDSVRFFLTWEAFQPTEHAIDSGHLATLVRVADLAHEAGLTVMPTLFTGHMSGINLIPAWAFGGPATMQRFRAVARGAATVGALRNWYTDDGVLAAQAQLAAACAGALAGHPALWAWDLGNENSNCVVPPTRRAGLDWLQSMSEAIRSADSGAAVTIGLHMEDLEQDRGIGPAEASQVCDFLTMHGYPIYAPWSAGPTDADLLGYLTEVTRWLGGGMAVAFTEFGLPTVSGVGGLTGLATGPMLVDEDAAANYMSRAVRTLHRAGATAAMAWCYGDYAPELWRDPPLDEATHERSFGLWRADGSPKAAVAALTAVAGELATVVAPRRADATWIDVEPDAFYTTEGSHLARLYSKYRATLV